ncbi:hypothetical protein A3C18_02605 [Candidatus Kaiserbacteria bacterium RIFCSPHIGHO2_02_FULL_54_11b]|uniref:Cohesin domain-containing protein n=1 Tax=Candidatus Kaiserbacteria bacterium RIFCSPHIGHO2_02_FULL_54_11b TaxID=1798494 RepID=A0A1F6DRR9_9BACT|nr:MAG: hypothetical protein A3C18_02605 [Candidatus Kaiserbacteria bacterium RIFCSPHIGHO2_02_FULL_54_11b]
MAKLYTIALIIFLASAAPATAGAAEIYISPPLGSHYKGENFEVNLLVNSDVAINAVSVVLNFPTQNLKVLDVSKKNSDLNFWVEEPSFSNTGTLGNIRLEGVILNPGFTGTGGRIVSVTFQAVGEGRPSINVSQS